MFRSFLKILVFCFYGALIITGVTLAVENRGKVELSLYPLPFIFETPLFVIGIILFTVGSFTGWLIAHRTTLKHRWAHHQAKRRVAALENELSALRFEQAIHPGMTVLK